MGDKIIAIKCDDCKCYMKLIIPDDNENYWKCPKCGTEIAESEILDEEKGI